MIEEIMDLGLFNGLISLNDLGTVPSSVRFSISSLVTTGSYLDASKVSLDKTQVSAMCVIPRSPGIIRHRPRLSSSTSVSRDPSPLPAEAFPRCCCPSHGQWRLCLSCPSYCRNLQSICKQARALSRRNEVSPCPAVLGASWGS